MQTRSELVDISPFYLSFLLFALCPVMCVFIVQSAELMHVYQGQRHAITAVGFLGNVAMVTASLGGYVTVHHLQVRQQGFKPFGLRVPILFIHGTPESHC